MSEVAAEAARIWAALSPQVAGDDPLKADTLEYIEAGEWGVACEAMAILAKRYGQEAVITPLLEPLMIQVMLAEEDDR